MSSDARSRLCPEHRNDRLPTQSCPACEQARRIAALEQTVEVLCERVEVREANRTDDKNADDERTATADERPNEAIEADRQTPRMENQDTQEELQRIK
jgi:hypothetical protein